MQAEDADLGGGSKALLMTRVGLDEVPLS